MLLAQGAGRRVSVIGGSMGALFAANLLLRDGWDVRVYERVAEGLTGRGAGIVTHVELLRVLERAGLDVGDDFGVDVLERRILEADGSVSCRQLRHQTLTSWDRLYRILRNGIPDDRYFGGRHYEGCDVSPRAVSARFADGSSAESELLIGADGFRSSVRPAFAPEVKPVYVGYVAWRGLIPEAALSQKAHADLFGYFAFCLPEGEQMLGYPVAGPDNDVRPGHRRYNFVWYRPADDDEFRRMLTDATGRTHEISIPPPLIDPSIVAQMRQAAENALAPQFAEVVRAAEAPFFQPIYDLESPLLASGRIAILGDAAFVARPHVGAGVTKAAEDALALSDALKQERTVEDALLAYQSARLPVGRAIVRRAKDLGAYMQPHIATEEERFLAEQHRKPEAVLEETAALDFMRELPSVRTARRDAGAA